MIDPTQVNPDQLYFRLYANCIPVKGAVRSVICDLHRGTAKHIPNDMYDILTEYETFNWSQIQEQIDPESQQELRAYFDFLVENEYGFWCTDTTMFSKLDLTYETPQLITNAIIDTSDVFKQPYEQIFEQLQALGCKAIQLRFFSKITLIKLEEILDLLEGSGIRSVEIYTPYLKEDAENIASFFNKYQRTDSLCFHSAPFSRIQRGTNTLVYSEETIQDETHCGFIGTQYFISNIAHFTEAQAHNTCLNKKISVDQWGHIKNCPAMHEAFGHISSNSLLEAYAANEFKSYWSIHKDQIDVCKDCEFRYICTDCRAFQKTDSKYAKPVKCNYDPYEAAWKEG